MSSTPSSPQRLGGFERLRAAVRPAASGAAGAGAPETPHSTFSAFRHRNYRLYWCGMVVSLTGTWMQNLGQQWLVLGLTGSPLWLGIIGFCQSIPVLLLTMFAGVVVDRVNKRHLLLCTQAAAMTQALALAALTLSGRVQVWHIMVAALVLGTINAFDMPARQSFVVEMVGKEDLANAIALNSSIFNTARIFGPALAGIIVSIPRIGPGGAFLLNGVSFLAVLGSLLMMKHTPGPARARSESVRANFIEGLRYVRSNRVIYTLAIMTATTSIFGMSYSAMMPIFAQRVLNVGSPGQGLMMACVGAGSLAAALVLASIAGRQGKGKVWSTGNLIFPVMLLFFAVSRSFALSLVILTVFGFAMIVQNANTNTLLQTTVPDHMRGRVMSLHTLTFSGMFPFGNLQVGAMANVFGAPLAVAVGAVVCLSVALLIQWRAPYIRRL